MRHLALLVGALAVAGFAGTAQAAPLSADVILHDFNAVIYGSASTPSDIEGAAVVGGNFSGAAVYSNPVAGQPPGYGALTVFGDLNGAVQVNNGGNAYVGGATNAAITYNGGQAIGAPGSTIADFAAPLNAYSQSLSQLAATAALPATGNNEVIRATPGANGIAVFNVTAAALAALSSFSLDANGASEIVFNIDGSSASFNANMLNCCGTAADTIWNFYDATGTVAINALIAGTVLAPGATVTNANQIDGTLVANAWFGNGELHDDPLTIQTVPEPSSLALLGFAAAILGVRRGRAKLVGAYPLP